MRRFLIVAVMLLTGSSMFLRHHPKDVLYAQSVPFVAHATFTPSVIDANHTAASQFKLTLDGVVLPIALAATACSGIPTVCLVPVSIPTFGNHTLLMVAENFTLSTDPTAPQDSPVVSVAFSLNQQPNAVGNGNVVR